MTTKSKPAAKQATTVEVSPLQYTIKMAREVDGKQTYNYITITPPEAEVLLKELERAVKFTNRS